MRHFTCALAGVSLVALATPALAQDRPRDPDIVVSAERVTEAAIQQVNETPGGADVVAADEFADSVAVSLREALAFSPGVYAQPRMGQEVRLSIRGSGISRGYHMRGLTLLQDGIPINLADDNGDFQELDPVNLERIEVFRGANALRYGASTLGGAINGVSPTGRSANGFRLRIDGGSFDTLRGFASAGFADARGDAYLAISGDRSDGTRDHADRKAFRFNGNVGLRLTDSIETRFYATVQSIDQKLPGALNYDTVQNDPDSGNRFNDQARDIDSIRIQNKTSFDLPSGGRLDAGLFLNTKDLHHPIFQLLDYKSTDWGAFTRLDQPLGIIDLSAGVTARFGTVDAKRFVNNNGERGAPVSDADLVARTIDAYAEARVSPISRLTLIAGAIYTSGMRRQDNVAPTTTSDRATFEEISPKFGVLFAPVANVQLYANYSRSHELPGFAELSQTSPFLPAGTFVTLDPQRAWTAEVGGRGTLGPVHFDVTYYRADVKGELLQFNTAVGTIPAATFNAGNTRHQGVEAGLDIALAPWLALHQTYMWSDFRFVDDPGYGDNRLPVVPEHVYRAELAVGTPAFRITPNVEWVPRGAWADYENSFRPDGYVLLGLGARMQLTDSVSVFADARNLTDRAEVGDIGAVVAYAPGSAIFYPVERRTVYGGIRAAF